MVVNGAGVPTDGWGVEATAALIGTVLPGRFKPARPGFASLEGGAATSSLVLALESGREIEPWGSLRLTPANLPAGALEGGGDTGGGLAEEVAVVLTGGGTCFDGFSGAVGAAGFPCFSGAMAAAALIRGSTVAREAGFSEFVCCMT